ncbi:MAG TPA: alkaline phosphatase family protein [Anaerolineae bacterium]|nr:alkaline phosphatase family protein [Anaerolineae bacterium]
MSAVVLVVIDGARPDALLQAHCPNVDRLRANGASSLQAMSVMPCLTLPCHTSIFYDVSPFRHGIFSNEWVPFAHHWPGLLEQVRAAKLKAAFFYNWEPLRDLSRPGDLACSFFRDNAQTPYGDQIVADEAARFIANEQPDFAFVYFGTVDTAGHTFGWMSDEYLRQLERVDTALGTVLGALNGQHTVIVQSDHGGHDRHHGQNIAEDLTIPWIAAGPQIRRGHAIERDVSLLDTAPTIARLLKLSAPARWEGLCLDEIFI